MTAVAALAIVLAVTAFVVPAVALGSAATLAVVSSTGVVCGITAGESPQSLLCLQRLAGALQLEPNISFSAVSGGGEFFCALAYLGADSIVLCWNESYGLQRLHRGAGVLTGLSVGVDHVCALDAAAGATPCWRGGRGFPTSGPSGLRSITSGWSFSCGITSNNSRVICWGLSPAAGELAQAFSNYSMSTLVAGDSHACGITVTGELICRGSGAGEVPVPVAQPFGFSALALEANRSCAVLTGNGTVVCWGGGRAAPSSPAGSIAFESIVSGSNLTCGLSSFNLSIYCWGSDDAVLMPASARFVPGPCVSVPCGAGDCQMYPDSGAFCVGGAWICRPCLITMPTLPTAPPFLLPSPPPNVVSPTPPPLPPPPPSTSSSRMNRGLLAFAIVGSIGAVSGICSILYCIWARVCRRKKVHNSVQPTIAAAGSAGNNNNSMSGVISIPGTLSATTPFGSRSGTIRRQGSRALSMMRRQRSGTSHADRAEEFTLAELSAATGGFSAENRIGSGSFGTVYRGKLADCREVAIKRGDTGGPRAKKFQEKESAFQSELAFLSRLHHKHLVGLVGFCEENEERLLVYEYMKHGALYDHLHSKNKNEISDNQLINSWKMRIKIALDAARGIEYLHYYAVPPIIHRDIKSSNILLDAQWTARVSDFGLSLMSSDSEMVMKAAGTVGYIDPEYYSLHHLTAKSDVYGFGVVLLELLTGRRAIFKEEGEAAPVTIVDYVAPKIAGGELAAVLDPNVGPLVVSVSEAVELVAYTAVHCVRVEGKDRPTMSDIVANLENALALCEDSHGSISSGSITLASD